MLAIALVVIAWQRPQFRYTWLIAVGGGFLTWMSILIWQGRVPIRLELPPWEPVDIFLETLSFTVDRTTWPFVFSITTLLFAVILTAAIRENFPAPLPWAATFVLGGLGILAVLADNALSLLMVWAAIDLAELAAQLRQQEVEPSSEKLMTVFAFRLAGLGMLLWASMVSISAGAFLEFRSVPPQAAIFIVLAAGLRLGVLPLHLPYASGVDVRRGFGSMLRLVSAASSLMILARIPASTTPLAASVLELLAAIAAVYAGWMWFRSPDELSARPYWLIGFASMAIVSTLSGNPDGAIAWGCGLILVGGAVFLTSVYNGWLNRLLLIGLWGISALPYSLTSAGLATRGAQSIPLGALLVIAHACLLAGYYRHAMRPSMRKNLAAADRVTIFAYALGISLLLVSILLLGIWGWNGALRFGNLVPAAVGGILAVLLYWSTSRFQLLAPIRAHWIRPITTSWTEWFSRSARDLYLLLGRVSELISNALEGEGGIMWTLLFLVVLISLFTQGLSAP